MLAGSVDSVTDGVAQEAPGERVGRGWLIWAAAIVPVMFILPMYVFPYPIRVSPYNARRLMEIVWAAGLLAAFLSPSIRASSAAIWAGLSLTTRVAAGGFVAWSFLSAVLSSAPLYALREWGLMTLLLVILLPLASIWGSRRGRLLELLALTLILYAILISPEPLEHGFANPRFQGQALAVVTPILLFAGHFGLALLASPALALGILSGSRALYLAIAVVTVAAWVLWPDRARRLWPGLVGIAAAGALVWLYHSLGKGGDLEQAVHKGANLAGRGPIWIESFQRFTQAPILGEGPGLLARSPGLPGGLGHPHNSVLQIAAETGLVGLAFVAALIVQGLRRVPTLTADRRPWALGLIAGAVHSLLSGTIIMPASQTLLVLALAVALPASHRIQPGVGTARRGWALAAVGVAALAILLTTLRLPGVFGTVGPRFFWPGIIP
jgi:O-antigen ligase